MRERNSPVLSGGSLEHHRGVIHTIELVDDDRDLRDAQQLQKVTVSARLFLHALVRVDDDEGGVGGRGAGYHVLDEFPVPRCVDQHVLAAFGTKPDLGCVDRDVLIALRLKCIGEICQLERDTTAPSDGNQLLVLPSRNEPVSSRSRPISVDFPWST